MLTGQTVWQRLVQATQREKVKTCLTESYPVQTVAKAIPVKSPQKVAASRRTIFHSRQLERGNLQAGSSRSFGAASVCESTT
jgi:hypothetical protein